MQIFCRNPRCNHSKISWYIKNEEIPFNQSDPHFRRESMDNFHRLWIDIADPSDEGTFSVKKENDVKECELEVLGKIHYYFQILKFDIISGLRTL